MKTFCHLIRIEEDVAQALIWSHLMNTVSKFFANIEANFGRHNHTTTLVHTVVIFATFFFRLNFLRPTTKKRKKKWFKMEENRSEKIMLKFVSQKKFSLVATQKQNSVRKNKILKKVAHHWLIVVVSFVVWQSDKVFGNEWKQELAWNRY